MIADGANKLQDITTGVLELKPPPLDPDQPNFSIWAGGFLIHISNSPKLARGFYFIQIGFGPLFDRFPLRKPDFRCPKTFFFRLRRAQIREILQSWRGVLIHISNSRKLTLGGFNKGGSNSNTPVVTPRTMDSVFTLPRRPKN